MKIKVLYFRNYFTLMCWIHVCAKPFDAGFPPISIMVLAEAPPPQFYILLQFIEILFLFNSHLKTWVLANLQSKKVYFTAKIENFLFFMVINFLVRSLQWIEIIIFDLFGPWNFCPGVKSIFSNVVYRLTEYKTGATANTVH